MIKKRKIHTHVVYEGTRLARIRQSLKQSSVTQDTCSVVELLNQDETKLAAMT
jgi:predicted site-specific integrase-resolvase